VSSGKGNVHQRILGRRLQLMRTAAGISIDAAARDFGISVSKLSRIEGARQGVDQHLVKSMLDLYDVGGDRWTETLELVATARKRPWWAAYTSDRGFGYVQVETDAEQVQVYMPAMVPGLLQTRAYARALFMSSIAERSTERVEAQVELRMIRQRRLTDTEHPLQLMTVIGESALRNPVGDPDVMHAQLAHLAEAAELPTVTMQVLPACPGPHASLASGYSVLSFGELGEPDLAYVEHALGAVHLEREEDVLRARKKFDQLRTLALSPAASLALLREIAATT
jgi:transcriptional regulator with XRE-family HTH domain